MAQGLEALAAMSPEQKSQWMAEATALRDAFAGAMADGMAPDDAALDPLLQRHHAWVTLTTGVPPTAEGYAALGRLNVEHAEFKAMYDAARPGLAEWMAEAMTAYGKRHL